MSTTVTPAVTKPVAPAPVVDANKEWKTKVKAAAKSAGEWYGVPAPILAGIATLESGWGKKLSAPHNYCGMKWSEKSMEKAHVPVSTDEVVAGKTVSIKAVFIAFRSLEHCMDHLAKKLRSQSSFAKFQQGLDKGASIEVLVNHLAKVYATDPLYGKKLLDVIASLEK